MRGLFTIGEMSRLFGLNVRTLRYYDSIGLLRPEHVDERTGYRRYSTRQFERLNTIKYLRALDMPIPRIRDFFANRDIDVMLSLLREQQAEIATRQRRLERIERKIRHRLDQIADAAASVYGRLEDKVLPERPVAFLRQEIAVGDDLEYPIRELERLHRLEPVIFLGKVGVAVAHADLEAGRFDRFSRIFVLLEREDAGPASSDSLPAGSYLTLRFRGTHRDAGGHYRKMLEHLRARGRVPSGDSVEVTLIDGGLTGDTDKFVTELQIPWKNA